MRTAHTHFVTRRNNRRIESRRLLREACRALPARHISQLEQLESRTLLSVVELNPIADTYVRDANPDTNYGSEMTLVVKNDRVSTAYSGNNRQTFLKFDLSGITGPITSATLVLTGQSDVNGDGYYADVYGVPNTNWDETSLTWNTRPAPDPKLQDSAFVVTNVDQVYQWNVTDWIAGHTGGQAAFTVTETYLVDNNGRMHFYSKENADKRPKLIISTGTPQAPTGAANLTATPQGGDKIRLNWSGVAQASSYQILRSTTAGTGYTLVGTSTTQSFVDAGLSPQTEYFYIIKGVNGTAVGAASPEAIATTFNTPAGWTGIDIGTALNPGAKGSASYDADTKTFTLQGGGSDIWNNGDFFYYFYQPFNTEGTITVQVLSQDMTGGWAKSGVMIRENLGLASRQATVATTPSNGIAMQTRPVDDVYGNCTSVNIGTGSLYAPYWVRLTRRGNMFVGEMSPDGTAWTTLSSQRIPMGTNVYIGLAVGAVTGAVDTVLNTSTFDNVTITPLETVSAPVLQELSFEGAAINLKFLENPFASKFIIERSTAADFSANLVTFQVDSASTAFKDTPADLAQTYYYRLKAVGPTGESTYSTVAGGNISAGTFVGNGVRVEYYNNHLRRGDPALTRFEIDPFEPFGDGNGAAGPGADADHFSSRWSGRVIAPATGTYTFISLTDDDGYLWVDGKLVSSDPGGHGYRDAWNLEPIDLTEGQAYDFILEQLDSGGGAYVRVDWVRPDGVRETIPTQYLRPDMGTLKPAEGTTKAAPSDLTIYNDGTNGYVALSWTDNARNETGFIIERATNSSFSDAVIVDRRPASTDTAATVYGYDAPIQPNTKYYYRVKAINPDNSSSYSNVVNVTTPADISLSGQGVAGHYYNITTRQNEPWFDYSGPDFVQLDSNIDFSSGSGWNPFGTSDTQISNLYFSVRWTGKVLADTAGVYTFISNTDDSGYLYVDGVLVSSDPGGPTGHGEQDAANRTPITLTAGWHNFIFEVGQGWGGFGAHMKWITPGNTTPVIIPTDHLEARSDIPAAPAELSSSGLTTGKVTITWKDNSINETVYYLERSTTQTFAAGTITQLRLAANYAPTMSYTDKSLAKDTDYYYRVRAANYDGTSAYGPVVHVRTPSVDVLPDAPSDLALTAPASHAGVSAGLFWKDNAYNEERFIVERKQGAAGTWATIATLGENATTYIDADPTLSPNQVYFYRVRAENGVGPSAYSAEVSITPAAPLVGTGAGLLGRYYNNEYFAGNPVASRIDRVVDFDFDAQHSHRPTGFNIENEGVVWVGRVQVQVTGYYTFATESDDGSYVYLDENPIPVVDNGGAHGRQRRTSAPIFLQAGSFHTIKATMFQGNGGANMTLEWSAPGLGTAANPFVVIPATQLYAPDFTAAMVAPTSLAITAMHGKNVLRWNNSATNIKGIKVLRATTADGPFTAIATVQPDTNAYYDAAVEAGKTYFYKVVNTNDSGDSTPTAAVSTTALSANLPQGWQQSEVGIPLYSPLLPGDGFYDPETATFTVIADGDDIWNQVDQFHFVYLPIPNVDGTITARLMTQDDTNAWAKSGLMFRDSLDQGARKVFLGMTPDSHGAAEFTGRVTSNYWSYHFPETGATLEGMYHPIDLRLVRQNNTFTAYAKGENDADWTQVGGPGVVTMTGSTIYVGLAVTSHTRGVLGAATFQNVAIETADLTQAPAAPTDFEVVEGAGGGLIQLNWTDNATNESGFKILRATTAGGQYEQIGSAPANATCFVDRNLTAGKTYYYKVLATNALAPAASQDSAPTSVMSVKPGSLAPVNYTDFTDTPALQLNQDAAAFEQDGKTILRLTPSANDKIGTVFTVDQRDITAFSTTFDFQITNPQSGGADGLCFVIQNSDAGAGFIGAGGGAMGYATGANHDASKSIAIKFDTWGTNTSAGTMSSTGLFINSDGLTDDDNATQTYANFPSVNMAGAGIDIRGGDVFRVTLTYDGSTLRQSVKNTRTNAEFTWSYEVNIPAIVGGPVAYVGFTAATGGANQNQDIRAWQFESTMPVIETPAQDWIINGTDATEVVTLKRNGDNVQLLDPAGNVLDSKPFAKILNIIINGQGGDDKLTLNLTGGDLVGLDRSITLNGGTGHDLLNLAMNSGTSALAITDAAVTLGNTTVNLANTEAVGLALSGSAKVSVPAGLNKALKLGGLSLADQATLELNDNDLIVSATPETRAAVLAAISQAIQSARGDGKWLGAGLCSSAAKANKQTGLAVMLNAKSNQALLAQFAGQSVGVNDILVKYTWNGDVNLDGQVDAADYFLVDSGYITQEGQYRNGDLNLDGVVDAADYFLVDSAYIAQTGVMAAKAPSVLQQLFSSKPVL